MKKHKPLKRVLALVLSCLMALSLLPGAAFAASDSVSIRFTPNYDSDGAQICYAADLVWDGSVLHPAGQAKKKILADGEEAWCLEPGVPLNTGTTLTTDAVRTWTSLSVSQQETVKLVTALYHTASLSGTEGEQNVAAQLLIWEFVKGARVSYGSYQRVDDAFWNAMFTGGANAGTRQAYEQLEALLADYPKTPSFMGTEWELDWDGSCYRAELTDRNDCLSGFNFVSSDPAVSVSVSDNVLTLTANQPLSGAVTITARKELTQVSAASKLVAYGADVYQEIAVGVERPEAVETSMSVKTSVGAMQITKTSEDGAVSGISFRITGAGVDRTVKTDGSGKVLVANLPSGRYTVAEQTGESYAPTEEQTVTVTAGQTAQVSFQNRLKQWRVTVTKVDGETSTAQGDATLAGAVYGIYQGGALVDSYTTDSNGQFTTNYYPCGADWTLKEITPSAGYQLDETVYSIGAEAKNYSAEYNDCALTVKEAVIQGKISIVKHTDDGATGIDTPEEGAQFQIYRKSAGSFDAAPETERDTLTCDADGWAESKDLPYGTYVVHQTSGWDGREQMPDFEVQITEQNKTYRYLLNDAVLKSSIEIVKKDAETGAVIPLAGAGFQVRSKATGELITQHLTYPTPVDIDTFYTDITGKLMLPEPLPYGDYELIEVQAPGGYVLSKESVAFTVDGTQSLVTVECFDSAQKGQITISKTGEVFQSVTETGGIYQPVYAEGGLAGAVYALTAAEDIYTPDGTLRLAAGELAAELTTDENGAAACEPLYLGHYLLTERTAPEGYVLDETPVEVELTYAGQEIEVTQTSVSCMDERQKVSVSLEKTMESDEVFHIQGNFTAVTFGLYTAEKLTAADGTEIPQDGLLELASVTEDGALTFQSDLPLGHYYLKEVSTDEGYICADIVYPVDFDYAGQDVLTVNIVANQGEAIKNDLLRGAVLGQKVADDDSIQQGVTFGLFRPGESEPILTAVTDESSRFSFENIPFGHYEVRELAGLDGYTVDETSHAVDITEDGCVIELTVTDERTKFEISKRDITNDEELPSAELTISALDGTEVERWISGDAPHSITGLMVGKTYRLTEVSAPNGFKMAESILFTVENTGEVQRVVMYDAPVPTEPVTAPKTGDTARIGPWLGLGAAALGGLCSLFLIRRKRGDR